MVGVSISGLEYILFCFVVFRVNVIICNVFVFKDVYYFVPNQKTREYKNYEGFTIHKLHPVGAI